MYGMGVWVFLIVCVGIGVWMSIARNRREAERPPSPVLVCPHCQVRGHVVAHPIRTKDGISGAKAAGAILTGGVSMLGTGLSRSSAKTLMHCGNCETDWLVA